MFEMDEVSVEEVEKVVDRIKAVAHDDEKAHAMEDALYEYVLREIMQTSTDPIAADLAAAALKTVEVDFARYYA